ncbi:MAG: hypothetical protein OXL97_01800 [Chloroflexota bacterium]|nr:hypothetical protein [Chloroflexota bacterium]MDE2886474.1 hypothetical protein [Chloroflexota bacterium]
MKKAQVGTTLRSTLCWALLLPLAVLATTGCFRIEIAFLVNDDGSGAIRYTVGVSDQVTAMMEAEGMEAEGGSLVEEEDLPPGAEVHDYSEDGYTGVVFTVPFTDYAEIKSIMESVDETDQGSGFGLDPPDISQDENGDWRFSMLMPAASEDDGSGDLLGMDALLGELLADGWFRVRVKLPGELADHNADRVENGELVWQMGLDSTEERQLTARATSGGGLSIVAIGAAAGVVVIALAAVAVLFFTRRGPAGRATS